MYTIIVYQLMGKLRNFFLFIVIVLLIAVAAYVGYILAFRNLILPRVSIANIEVTGMDKDSAKRLVEHYFKNNPSVVILRYEGKEYTNFENFNVEYDFVWAVDQAMLIGRSGNVLTRIKEQAQALYKPRIIQVPSRYDIDEMIGVVDELGEEINSEPVWPTLEITGKNVALVKGKNGITIDKDKLKSDITSNLLLPGTHLVEIPMERVVTEESTEQSNKALAVAQNWIDKKLELKGKDTSFELSPNQIVSLFGLYFDPISSTSYEKIIAEIKPVIEREPVDAVFTFEEDRVKEFKPEVVGTKIDIPALKEKLAVAIYTVDEKPLQVPLILSYPDITVDKINNLGIKELIGKGTSEFAHSIPGRVFNVNLAASRINGVIIPPGEEFSFNKHVGEISRDTGYQSAYIISGGRTVLGDGGGVCQVSTTVFRAALNSGLPITERKAHAYRVGYYEQDSKPGIDATVYNPSVDLKFKNDTGNHILVQTKVDTKKLVMSVEIYGTSDGRVASITEPKISGQTAPPQTIYVDDPTLPAGTTKQIDWSAWGAKVSFDYKVERGGEILIEKTFYSNYQPWQAVYLKGTKTN